MYIIIYRKFAIERTLIVGVKKGIAIITEITRVLPGPLVIYSYFCSSGNFTNIAFLNTGF